MSIEIKKISTRGFEMEYFTIGSGKTSLVILPGISVKSVMLSADAIAAQYEDMCGDFTLYFFDRRKDMPESYSVYDMARDTARAVKAAVPGEICLFGASQGGMMACVIAAEDSGIVSKLALGSSAFAVNRRTREVAGKWIEFAENGEYEKLYLDFGEKLYPREIFEMYKDFLVSQSETVTAAEAKRFITLAKGLEGYDMRERAREIKCPSLLLLAEDDAVLGKEHIAEAREIIKDRSNFELFIYSGYGHAAFDTAPDYRQKLKEFFLK